MFDISEEDVNIPWIIKLVKLRVEDIFMHTF